jgi:4-carboxymuconolactone decarboxylase
MSLKWPGLGNGLVREIDPTAWVAGDRRRVLLIPPFLDNRSNRSWEAMMNISEASKQRGREVRKALGGTPDPGNPTSTIAYELVPDLQDYMLGAVFGDIWGRPQLDLKTRAVVTLASLATQGREPQLRAHINYALNLGWTQEEIAEMFVHVMVYAGAPSALNALRVAGEVFKARG